jgi:glutamate synthase (NADPH/NADH) large chain
MPVEMDAAEAERQLYLVRRRIEKAVIKHMINDFYLCSLVRAGRSFIKACSLPSR